MPCCAGSNNALSPTYSLRDPMSKATVRPMPFETRQDPDTGARITRLTPRDVTCHRNYFYQ